VGRLRRRDALPEYLDWTDTGCEVAPRCLDCPLARCRYDVPGGLRAIRLANRNAELRAAYTGGTTARELARAHGLTSRTVYRALGSKH
jgi:hypothetical protein